MDSHSIAAIGLIAMTSVFFLALNQSNFVLVILLLASQFGGFVDPMTFASKGVFDIHAIIIVMSVAVIVISFKNFEDLRNAIFFRFLIIFAMFWVFGVIYPVIKNYSTLFYALKGSKEFMMFVIYIAVYLFITTKSEIDRAWNFIIGLGLYYAVLEIVSQVLGVSLLQYLEYEFRREGGYFWKIYPPFWPVILVSLLYMFYGSVLGDRVKVVRLGVATLGLLLTFFRSYLLGTIVAVPIVLYLSKKIDSSVLTRSASIAVCFGSLFIVLTFLLADGFSTLTKLTDEFLFSAVTEFNSNEGGALQGREKYAIERRKILEISPNFGFGFIDKESSFGIQKSRYITGHTLGFLDVGDLDVALKFGYCGRFLFYSLSLLLAYKLIKLSRSNSDPVFCVRTMSVATMILVYLIVQPVHAPLTYSFGLLPLFVMLGLLDKELALKRVEDI